MGAEVESSGQDDRIYEPREYDQPPLDDGRRPVFGRVQHFEHRSGPMPDGAEMMRYKEVDPSLPASIVSMAQDEQKHRHEMDRLAMNGALDETKRGQYLGFSIAGFVLLLSGVMAIVGFPVLAGILAAIDVVGLAAVFLGARYVQKNDEPPSSELGAEE